MYSDPEWRNKKIYPVGVTFRVLKGFKRLCCDFEYKKGDVLRVMCYSSKKRVLVENWSEDGKVIAMHKIKKGMLTNYCEEIDDDLGLR